MSVALGDAAVIDEGFSLLLLKVTRFLRLSLGLTLGRAKGEQEVASNDSGSEILVTFSSGSEEDKVEDKAVLLENIFFRHSQPSFLGLRTERDTCFSFLILFFVPLVKPACHRSCRCHGWMGFFLQIGYASA